MIPLYHESDIDFSFPEHWHPIQYDKCEPYKSMIMPLQNACAVDFLCCCENRLILMEVMRFKEKTFDDPEWVINKISTQVKDTIFGLAIFHLKEEPAMEKYTQALFNKFPAAEQPKLNVFLEIDNDLKGLAPDKVKADILDKLRKRFGPLGFVVRVLDSHNIDRMPWTANVK